METWITAVKELLKFDGTFTWNPYDNNKNLIIGNNIKPEVKKVVSKIIILEKRKHFTGNLGVDRKSYLYDFIKMSI